MKSYSTYSVIPTKNCKYKRMLVREL